MNWWLKLPELRRDQARAWVVVMIAVAHFALIMLAAFGRLGHTHVANWPMLNIVADHIAWLYFHGITGAWLLFAVLFNKHLIPPLSASAGVMGSWSFFNLLWGLSAIDEVTLTGSVLGLIISVITYIITWTFNPKRKG